MSTTEYMPGLLDREVRSREDDAFGHRHFVAGLRSLIEDESYTPPYTIGLLGSWGTGKSTIKKIYLTELANDVSRRDGLERCKRIHTVEFNAWRHGNDDIKRSLLRVVYLALGGSDKDLQREFFGQVEEVVQQRKPTKDFILEMLEKWVFPVAALAAALFVTLYASAWIVELLEPLWAGITVPMLLLGVGWLLKDVFNIRLQPLSRHTPVTVVNAPSTTAEQYESLLLKQLNVFKNTAPGKHCKRIVVFIDDLDRLSADEMVEGLDAIRTFMDIPDSSLPKDCGVVFIVSCDETRVAEALSRRAWRSRDTNMIPGAIKDLSDARTFLDRIFQFRLEIPPIPRRDLRDFANQKLAAFPDVVADVSSAGVSLSQLVGRLMHVGVESPRNAVQIINAFLQSWWLAKKRESEGIHSVKAGALRPKAVTGHPISLAALSVLKMDFPDFYEQLQVIPELLVAYQRVVFDGAPLTKEPIAIQEAMTQLVGIGDDGSALAKDRNLRRFMASLRDIRWPRSLRPMLLLTEDKLSRELGDRAEDVRDFLVSGDTKGVLEALGRANDEKELTENDGELVADIFDYLTAESDDRRDSACIVIADLLPRIPESRMPSLVTRLSRRLSDSRALRCRMGIERISKVSEVATSVERRNLVSRLCQEVLRASHEEWIFTTPSLEMPRLDAAIAMAESTCELGLDTWATDGMLPAGKESLVSWLKSRRLTVGGETSDIPFLKLDEWTNKYEGILLPEMGEVYVGQLLRQMEIGIAWSIDFGAAFRRVDAVLISMKDAGQSSTSRMWKLVGGFGAVKQKEGPMFAWEFLTKHSSIATQDDLSSVIQSLTGRLDKEMKDAENWPLDWKGGALSLLAVCETRPSDLNQDALNSLSALVQSWAEVDDTVDFAVRGIDVITAISSETAKPIIDDWISGFKAEANIEFVKWLARKFDSRLSESQQQALIGQLNHYVDSDTVTDDQGLQFQSFIATSSPNVLKHALIADFAVRLFSTLAARFNNASYLEAVFPAVPRLMGSVLEGKSSAMLKKLFEQAKTTPANYGKLHEWMAGHWPTAPSGGYEPSRIFDDAASFAQSSPSQQNAVGPLRSMSSMLKTGLVDSSKQQSLAESACYIWPYNAEEVEPILLDCITAPSPKLISQLAFDIDATSEIEIERLKRVWQHLSAALSIDERTQVGNELLVKGPLALPIGVDGALQLWIDLVKQQQDSMLHELISNSSHSDSQRQRIWNEIERRSSELGPGFFNTVIPAILTLDDCPDTIASVLRWRTVSADLIKSRSDKAAFCKALAPAYFDTPSAETRDSIAKWITDFNGESAIEMELLNREVSDVQRESLISHFASIRVG